MTAAVRARSSQDGASGNCLSAMSTLAAFDKRRVTELPWPSSWTTSGASGGLGAATNPTSAALTSAGAGQSLFPCTVTDGAPGATATSMTTPNALIVTRERYRDRLVCVLAIRQAMAAAQAA
jgi:hypothetical protein